MQLSCAAEPAEVDNARDEARGLRGPAPVGRVDVVAGTRPLRHELRANLAVAGFSVGLSVVVAVGLSLLMTLLG